MRTVAATVARGLRVFWRGLRQWSGDAAYEQYVSSKEKSGARVALSESEFYREQLNRKYERPNRCC